MRPRNNLLLYVLQILALCLGLSSDGWSPESLLPVILSPDANQRSPEFCCTDEFSWIRWPAQVLVSGALNYTAKSTATGEASRYAPHVYSGIGQGFTASMRPRNNLLLYVLQGSKKHSYSKCTTSFRCLVVLPCPRAFCDGVAECFDAACMLVLLLSGDIEMNPGPNDSAMQELLKGQKEILEVMGTIRKKLDDYIALTDQRLDSIESELKCLAGKSVQFERCEKTVDRISAGIVEMQVKLDDLENRSRRNNLVVYGLKESTGETTESLRKTVLDDILLLKWVSP
ncbi:hypothetical protein HPB51_012399 [Rhipicephalus microplus]|uniref:Uncharacterized protein n=1 Tax=Rhipicephalus microplus TaxID=6941 RepID=A0A9J6E8P7_RHIMP|nr:hypothetical protein HPB51_012399 [Rhipicephalus microplus]